MTSLDHSMNGSLKTLTNGMTIHEIILLYYFKMIYKTLKIPKTNYHPPIKALPTNKKLEIIFKKKIFLNLREKNIQYFSKYSVKI